MAIGICVAAGALVLAALGLPVATGAAEMPEACHGLAARFARAPDQATLAALQACLAGERPDSAQMTALPSIPAMPPKRAWGEWPPSEPWMHTSESWPQPRPW